jgi:divalent metal cation (Fe/Co/Zn/Cd) transporter
VFDGIASLLIGALLAVTALLLARETKELLIGERAHEELSNSILALAEREQGIEGVNGILTVHLAPHQIVVTLSVEFADDLRTPQIERCVEILEHKVRDKHPDVMSLFVKPQTRHRFETTPGAHLTSNAPRRKAAQNTN